MKGPPPPEIAPVRTRAPIGPPPPEAGPARLDLAYIAALKGPPPPSGLPVR
jgi:hypothetical protein